MSSKTIRNFSKRGDALPVPTLTRVQADAYRRFLQLDKSHDQRNTMLGLEALLREVFPIASYDNSMKLEYLYYKLDEPRYTADECRELRLTYGRPFRIGVRLVREGTSEIAEEEIYLGEIPIMMGGGEFIVNETTAGAQRRGGVAQPSGGAHRDGGQLSPVGHPVAGHRAACGPVCAHGWQRQQQRHRVF